VLGEALGLLREGEVGAVDIWVDLTHSINYVPEQCSWPLRKLPRHSYY
jgi:hypothetical protein